MGLHKPAQALARQRALGDLAYGVRTVRNFPGLADGLRRRNGFLVEPLQIASSPNAFLEDRSEGQRVEHKEWGVTNFKSHKWRAIGALSLCKLARPTNNFKPRPAASL